MFHFNTFYDDWVDCSPIFKLNGNHGLPVSLSNNFFDELRFDPNSLKQYRIEAAIECAKTLGDNPALCISGGVDSQCMLQAWTEAQLNFKTYVFVFNDNLNIQDVSQARLFCKKYNIELIELNFDIISFLTRENYDIGIKYHSASPHFNTHYKFFDLLKEQGHSGVCCGGMSPSYNNDVWGGNFNKNTMNFILYNKIREFPCQGSFLSFYPKLSWAISLLTPKMNVSINPMHQPYDRILKENQVRYTNKTVGYTQAGFNILPQDKKYTGFEFVKTYFQQITGDGREFEKRFRTPLETLYKGNIYMHHFEFVDSEIDNTLFNIYTNNMRSRGFS